MPENKSTSPEQSIANRKSVSILVKCDKNAHMYVDNKLVGILYIGKERQVQMNRGVHSLKFINAGNDSEFFCFDYKIDAAVEGKMLEVNFEEQIRKYEKVLKEQSEAKNRRKQLIIHISLLVFVGVLLVFCISNTFDSIKRSEKLLSEHTFDDEIYDRLANGAVFIYTDNSMNEYIYGMDSCIWKENKDGKEVLFELNKRYPMTSYSMMYNQNTMAMTLKKSDKDGFEIQNLSGLRYEWYDGRYLIYHNQKPLREWHYENKSGTYNDSLKASNWRSHVIVFSSNSERLPVYIPQAALYKDGSYKVTWSEKEIGLTKKICSLFPHLNSEDKSIIEELCDATSKMSFHLLQWSPSCDGVRLNYLGQEYTMSDYGDREVVEKMKEIAENKIDGMPVDRIKGALPSSYMYCGRHLSNDRKSTFVSVLDPTRSGKNRYLLYRISNTTYDATLLHAGCDITFGKDAIYVKVHDTVLLFFDSYDTVTYDY